MSGPHLLALSVAGYKVTKLQSYRVTGLQGYRVTGLQGYRVTGLQGYAINQAISFSRIKLVTFSRVPYRILIKGASQTLQPDEGLKCTTSVRRVLNIILVPFSKES
jgi:hypothetical protein